MNSRPFAVSREHAIQRVKERLARDSFPRIQMALLVSLTGGFGLLASFTLLQFGLDSMAVRYPVALLFSYTFFLFLLWLWLRTNAKDYLDAPDVSGAFSETSPTCTDPDPFCGHGGTFDGGGASGNFESSAVPLDESVSTPLSSGSESIGSIADADELAIPLAAIALAVGVALASLYVIYIAPLIFAELLVDGALSYALFRHLRGKDPQHWLAGTLRRTVIPFVATAVFLEPIPVGLWSAK